MLSDFSIIAGNIIIENEICQLSDIENYMLSIPPYYKQFYSQFRKIHVSMYLLLHIHLSSMRSTFTSYMQSYVILDITG